jgi:hypothetical protein
MSSMMGLPTHKGERLLYRDDMNMLEKAGGALEGYAQIMGSELRMIGEMGGEMIGLTASTLTPDVAKDKLAEWGTKLMSTAVGQKGLEALQWGGAKWSQFAKEYPQEAKSLAAGFDIALMTLPGTKGPKVSKAVPSGKAKQLLLRGKTQRLRERTKAITKMLEPDPADAAGDMDAVGLFGVREITPQARDLDMAQAVQRVTKVDPRKSYLWNAARVRDAHRVLREKLDAQLIKFRKPIPRETVEKRFQQGVEQLESSTTLVGDSEEIARRVIDMAWEYIDKTDGTPLALLQARRDLDKALRLEKPSLMTGAATAQQQAFHVVRDAINDVVVDAAPTVAVRKSLREQHLLRSAVEERLHPRAVKEGANTFIRVLHNVRDTTGIHLPTTPLAIGATVGVGASFAAPIGAAMGVGAGAAGVSWLTGKALRSPETKQLLAMTLLATNKALKVAEGPVLEQLKADRMIIIDLIHESNTPWSEEDE